MQMKIMPGYLILEVQTTKYSPLPNCFILVNKNKKINLFCNLNKSKNKFKKKI